MKDIYKKPTINIIFNGDMLETVRNKTEMSTIITAIQYCASDFS